MHAGRALIMEPKPRATCSMSTLLLGVWSGVSAVKSQFGIFEPVLLEARSSGIVQIKLINLTTTTAYYNVS